MRRAAGPSEAARRLGAIRAIPLVGLLWLPGCLAPPPSSGGAACSDDDGTCPDAGGGGGGGRRDTGRDNDAAGGGGDTGAGTDTLIPTPDDQDGDGIPDAQELNTDTDGDGVIDLLDPDSDDDGIGDGVEGTANTDGDADPDARDLDSDNDGLPDFLEGIGDSDDDGELDYRDTDSDGDTIPDSAEGTSDSDGDGEMDFRDPDSDNDSIPDRFEGTEDVDLDTIPNYLDTDSDGDGWRDIEEYGQTPGSGMPPVDRDGDRFDDFIDIDSDSDGLADSSEQGCPASTSRADDDSDDDSYSDMLEVAFGSDPCNPASDITAFVDFFFELPYLDPEQHDTLDFSTDVRQGDVAFNMDTTGSMGGEINQLRSRLSSFIIPALASQLPDAAYGVSRFDDFPCCGWGDGGAGDQPFILVQRITRNAGVAQNGVNRLDTHYGEDYPESGIESLYQIATGTGQWGGGASVPAFNGSAGLVPGEADGTIGGVGFRSGAVPIVVHITDAPSHSADEGGYPGATRDQAFSALAAIGAKVIGVASGGDARGMLEEAATRTGARVPPCAWDEARPGGCGAGQCCTGSGGAGRGTDGGGLCPMVFDIGGDGGGLDQSIVTGIIAVVRFSRFDLNTRVRRDETEFTETGIDTSCFLKGVLPVTAVAPPGACSTTPVPADFNGDGILDGFRDVTPGTTLYFDVVAMNDCVEPSHEPLVFLAYIDVVGAGGVVLDTRLVTILVPPDVKQ